MLRKGKGCRGSIHLPLINQMKNMLLLYFAVLLVTALVGSAPLPVKIVAHGPGLTRQTLPASGKTGQQTRSAIRRPNVDKFMPSSDNHAIALGQSAQDTVDSPSMTLRSTQSAVALELPRQNKAKTTHPKAANDGTFLPKILLVSLCSVVIGLMIWVRALLRDNRKPSYNGTQLVRPFLDPGATSESSVGITIPITDCITTASENLEGYSAPVAATFMINPLDGRSEANTMEEVQQETALVSLDSYDETRDDPGRSRDGMTNERRAIVRREAGENNNWSYPTNYYELLDLDVGASADEIKSSYRRIQKMCHPDVAGEDGTEVCILLNDAYSLLTDDVKRQNYDVTLERANRVRASMDEEHTYDGVVDTFGYTGQMLSTWAGAPGETEAVFVDESTCIGCRACVHVAGETFGIEEDFGRARVHTQWGSDKEKVTIAVESCPVDCIHKVPKDDVALLEYCMSRARRVNIGVMMSNPSASGDDPFDMASSFQRKRMEDWKDWNAAGGNPADWTLMHEGFGIIGGQIKRAWARLSERIRRKAWTSWSGEFDDIDM